MTAPMDEHRQEGYLRRVQMQRPSRKAALATAAAAALLAVGGMLVGRGTQDPGSPAAVALQPAPQAVGSVEIKVPAVAVLPRR